MWSKLDFLECIKIFACLVIVVGGLIGNLCIILAIALKRIMRTTINVYIANLAIADTMICVTCMIPHTLYKFNEENYIMGSFMCKFSTFVGMASLASSVLTLSAVSCDRFKAVSKPFQVRITKQHRCIVLLTVWIISIGVTIPELIMKEQRDITFDNFTVTKCVEKWSYIEYYEEGRRKFYRPLRVAYYSTFGITLFFVPAVIVLIAYFLILYTMSKATLPGEEHAANVRARFVLKRKMNKMVFVVLVAFVICWTPLQVIILYAVIREYTGKGNAIPLWISEFIWFAKYIAYANSFLNPIIYGGFNKAFRHRFYRNRRGPVHKSQTTSNPTKSVFRTSVQTVTTALTSLGTRTCAVFSRSRNPAPKQEHIDMEIAA